MRIKGVQAWRSAEAPRLLCNMIRGWEFEPEMAGFGRAFRTLEQCPVVVVKPRRELELQSCGSCGSPDSCRGVQGGSKNKRAPPSPGVPRQGAEPGGAGVGWEVIKSREGELLEEKVVAPGLVL